MPHALRSHVPRLRRPRETSVTVRPRTVTGRRQLAWLAGGTVLAFLIPFVLADRLALQRDLFYAVHIAFATGLFVAWARDTGESLPAMLARHAPLAVGLGLLFAGVSVAIVLGTEDATPRPEGVELIGQLAWRGLAYGAADGLLLSAFPILVVLAALRGGRLRARRGGPVAAGALAMLASLVMTVTYHLGYEDFRSGELRRPMSGTLLWGVPTLVTLNPVGSVLAHTGLHVAAVAHSPETELFLPPH